MSATPIALLMLAAASGAAAAPPTAPEPAAAARPAPPRWLADYEQARLDRGRDAMIALTTWGGANLVAGAIGWPLSDEPAWQAFHSMNLAWGAVNLAIALPSLVGHLRADPTKAEVREVLKAEHGLQATLLLNLGLDVAYLTAGALLWERGEFGDEPLLTGFGRSLIVQGAFLLVFDAVFYAVSAQASGALYSRLGEQAAEVGWVGRF